MKRIAIIFTIWTFLQAESFCQDNLTIGIKGGLNVSTLSFNGTLSDPKFGGHLGMYALIEIAQFNIQPEIFFSGQGATYTGFTGARLKSTFNYLNIPILIKRSLQKGFNIHFGPQFGYLLKHNFQDDQSGSVIDIDYRSIYKKTDFGLALGLGWTSPKGLEFDFRYTHGITKINTSFAGGSTRNRVINLSISYPLSMRQRKARYSTTPKNKRKG